MRPTPMHPALQGPHRDATHLGGFLVRQALRRNQDQSLPILGRKSRERLTHVRKVTPCMLLRQCPQASGVEPIRVLKLASYFPMLAVERIAQDCEQPCSHARARLELIEVGPSEQNGLLHEIVSVVRVVGQREGEGPQVGDCCQYGLADLRSRCHGSVLRAVRPKREARSRMRSRVGCRRSWPEMSRSSRSIRSWMLRSSLGSEMSLRVPQRDWRMSSRVSAPL